MFQVLPHTSYSPLSTFKLTIIFEKRESINLCFVSFPGVLWKASFMFYSLWSINTLQG